MSRLDRARRLLASPGAWLDRDGAGYALRLRPGRNVRVHLMLDEAAFRDLVARPGLATLPGGGWRALHAPGSSAPEPGRPGFVAGERDVVEHGRIVRRASNLGATAIAWLASRCDAEGRPLLSRAEIAAGQRLTLEAEIALRGPSLTMRWDALPRSGGGSAARVEPTTRALAAGRRVAAALQACGPARGLIDAVCVRGSALQAAERDLGLGRGGARRLLRQGLDALARHYGMV